MTIITSRRALITGLISLVAAPAIVRVASIMPVKVMPPKSLLEQWIEAYPPLVRWHEHVNCRCQLVPFSEISWIHDTMFGAK